MSAPVCPAQNSAFLRSSMPSREFNARSISQRVFSVDRIWEREKMIFSLSQMRATENTRWLMDPALDYGEGSGRRKEDLKWAGPTGADQTQPAPVHQRTLGQEMNGRACCV